MTGGSDEKIERLEIAVKQLEQAIRQAYQRHSCQVDEHDDRRGACGTCALYLELLKAQEVW